MLWLNFETNSRFLFSTVQALDITSLICCTTVVYLTVLQPDRHPNIVKWYVCGADYMEAAAEAMESARERIFICDWQISPCVYLKRPFSEELGIHVPDDYWRLDNLLQRKANQGVRIYILLYQDPSAMGLGNYEACKYLRRFNRKGTCLPSLFLITFVIVFVITQLICLCLQKNYSIGNLRKEGESHGNIFCLTHPDSEGPMNWAHHEKIIVCDEKVAFVSGIDLSIGTFSSLIFRFMNSRSMGVTRQIPALRQRRN